MVFLSCPFRGPKFLVLVFRFSILFHYNLNKFMHVVPGMYMHHVNEFIVR